MRSPLMVTIGDTYIEAVARTHAQASAAGIDLETRLAAMPDYECGCEHRASGVIAPEVERKHAA